MFFKKRNNFSSITVNGETITCSGSSIAIQNNIVVDGKIIKSDIGHNAQVVINGNVNKIVCSGSVEVHGDSGAIDCGGSCTVGGEVVGNIDAGGSVTCGNVSGDIDAGGSVRCRR
jgi:hypothetical protein